jgi:hypothetical protein
MDYSSKRVDTAPLYQWASEHDLSSKATHNLVQATEELVDAAQKAIEELSALVAKATATEGEEALGAIIYHARLAGYSNVVEANVSKVRQQAGRIEGIVSATV